MFPRYWIEALRDAAADTDKNEMISALEAFKFAEAKTKQFYDTNKRLATEHPMLDGGDTNATLSGAAVCLAKNRLDPESGQRSGQTGAFDQTRAAGRRDRSSEVSEGRHAHGRVP